MDKFISYIYGIIGFVIVALIAGLLQHFGISFKVSFLVAIIIVFSGCAIWIVVQIKKSKRRYQNYLEKLQKYNEELEALEKDFDDKY